MAANSPHPYIATIKNVREVALTCSANLAFWQDYLRKEGLHPCDSGGQAELSLIAIESRFMGILFRELSISVMIASPENLSQPAGSFLLHAYNSQWLLALSERLFFQTPYYPAQIRLNETIPASVQVQDGSTIVMNAVRAVSAVKAERDDYVLEGPIYLPDMRGQGKGDKVFYARLSGDRESYPFQPGDTLKFAVPENDRAFRSLLDSGATGKAWHIRRNAVHARSKSYPRP